MNTKTTLAIAASMTLAILAFAPTTSALAVEKVGEGTVNSSCIGWGGSNGVCWGVYTPDSGESICVGIHSSSGHCTGAQGPEGLLDITTTSSDAAYGLSSSCIGWGDPSGLCWGVYTPDSGEAACVGIRSASGHCTGVQGPVTYIEKLLQSSNDAAAVSSSCIGWGGSNGVCWGVYTPDSGESICVGIHSSSGHCTGVQGPQTYLDELTMESDAVFVLSSSCVGWSGSNGVCWGAYLPNSGESYCVGLRSSNGHCTGVQS